MAVQVEQFLTSQTRDRYERDGFLVLPGLLGGETLQRCQAAAQRMLDDAGEIARKRGGSSYGKVFLQSFGIGRQDPAFAEVTYSPELGRLAAHLGGFAAARVFIEQLIVKYAGDVPTAPHQDAPFLSYDDTRSLNFWIALGDVDESNGTLSYYPGSHRHGNLGVVHLDQGSNMNPAVNEVVAAIRPVTLKLRAGDAAVHNSCTIHSAGPNHTDRGRAAVAVQFMPDGAVYNGIRHDFFGAYAPEAGQILDSDLFPRTTAAVR